MTLSAEPGVLGGSQLFGVLSDPQGSQAAACHALSLAPGRRRAGGAEAYDLDAPLQPDYYHEMAASQARADFCAGIDNARGLAASAARARRCTIEPPPQPPPGSQS